MGSTVANRNRRPEWLQVARRLGEDVMVIRRRRALIPLLLIVLSLTGCGDDGESAEEREIVVQMLERLGYGRSVSECMADEFDGAYGQEDLQTMIDARGDMGTVNLQLVEDVSVALSECTSSDG